MPADPLDLAGMPELRPVGMTPEMAGTEHPSRPAPLAPPADHALRRRAEELDVAADAWRPDSSR